MPEKQRYLVLPHEHPTASACELQILGTSSTAQQILPVCTLLAVSFVSSSAAVGISCR